MRRRNAASERSRTSSALSAVTTVSRPRRFSATRGGAFGAVTGRAAPPGPRRIVRGASSSSASRTGRAATTTAGLGLASSSPPNRFLATSSALRLLSSSCLRRSSSSRLRASAASRSVFSRVSRSRRRRASSSAILRSSASRTRASARRSVRCLISSWVRGRSTTPDGFGAGAAGIGAALAGAATFAGAGA